MVEVEANTDTVCVYLHRLFDDSLNKIAADNRTDGGQNDKTSFLYRQRDWGTTQETYAPIVWQYEKKGHVDPTYINEPWHYGRRLIIDYWLEPVRTIKTLPATLTSEIEGCLIEAMRRTDLRIVLQDLRALM